jgi:hypothetical protein
MHRPSLPPATSDSTSVALCDRPEMPALCADVAMILQPPGPAIKVRRLTRHSQRWRNLNLQWLERRHRIARCLLWQGADSGLGAMLTVH